MDCSDVRDDMLDVLYGEASPAVARRVEAHQAECPACRAEMESLSSTRRTIQAWKLPELSRRVRGAWAWSGRGLAAAAGILIALGAGMGLAGSEFRYENGRVSFRVGRGGVDLKAQLASQEEQHRQEVQALLASLPGNDTLSDTRVLARVRDMIRESEARQAVLLTSSLKDLAQSNDLQRRYDLARISAGLSYLDERNGEHVARTTELMGYVLQAAEKR